jgi:glycerol-3-phosphate dehydrogenase
LVPYGIPRLEEAMGGVIQRDPQRASRQSYDLIVVGGGIYGACLILEATRRGLRALLLERDDFGAGTSLNSLRILHGGLRYLQTLDLHRFRESVRERRWFCQNFPDLVRPLPCLMPLYGRGLKRPLPFRAALIVNDWLSRRRNEGVPDACHLPGGRLLDPCETAEWFPMVNSKGLQGAGLWYDAVMTNSQRIQMEILRWAAALNATFLNHVEAVSLLTESDRTAGIEALDCVTARTVQFRAGAVINCAGPWSRRVAAAFDRDLPRLFQPSLAFNVLLDKVPLSQAALAVEPPFPGARVYFMHPWRGQILLGTMHEPWRRGDWPPAPTENQLARMISDLNAAVPGFQLRRHQIVRIYAGLLPSNHEGSHKLTKREILLDHRRHGGPKGLVSLCGIKYTTARLVAEKALGAINPEWRRLPYRPHTERLPCSPSSFDLDDPAQLLTADPTWVRAELARLISEEAVVDMDDLLYRRTDWCCDPRVVPDVERRVLELMPEGWLEQDAPLERAKGTFA